MKRLNDDFFIDESQQIGKGNFGVVYKGYQVSENRLIAIKFLNRAKMNNLGKINIEREIEVMELLGKFNHPNIMGYYGKY